MAQDALSPDAIAVAMAEALPNHENGDTNSDLSSSYEALALFTHACMANLGFRLLGFNEDQKIEKECNELAPRLSPKWNATFNSHSFVYAHTQSSMTFTVKVDRVGSRAEVRGLASGSDRMVRFDVSPRDYVSSAALPLRVAPDEEEDGRGGGKRRRGEDAELLGRLRAVFVSRERMADLASLVKVSIVQRLVPGLNKEGYLEESEDNRAAEDDARRPLRETRPGAALPPRGPPAMPDPMPAPAQPYPHDDPLADARPPRPRGPAPDFPPPGFEDEYEVNRQRATRVPVLPRFWPSAPGDSRPPFGIGHDDLNPPGLGPHDPLRASFVGGGGMLPRPGGRGGGMHPTFDDPLFGGPRGGGDGGGAYDPQIPPGARYDPLGPGGGPRGSARGGSGHDNSPFGGGFGGGIL